MNQKPNHMMFNLNKILWTGTHKLVCRICLRDKVNKKTKSPLVRSYSKMTVDASLHKLTEDALAEGWTWMDDVKNIACPTCHEALTKAV